MLVVEHVEDLAGKDRTTDEVVELVLARYRLGSRSLLSATVTPTETSMRRWLGRLAVRCGAHLVSIKTPRRGELADFAAGLSATRTEDVHCWGACTNVAEVLGEQRRQTFAAELSRIVVTTACCVEA